MRYVPFAFIIAVLGYLTAREAARVLRQPMKPSKPKKDERVSPHWLNEHAYERGQDGDDAA